MMSNHFQKVHFQLAKFVDCHELMKHKTMKIRNFKYALVTLSHWSLPKSITCTSQSWSCMLAAHRTDNPSIHMTAVVSMNRFNVIFIFFSIFSVQSWRPCWCCWSLITTNCDIIHHMSSLWHSLNGIKTTFLPLSIHYHTMFFQNKVAWGKPEGVWLHLSTFIYTPGCNIIHRGASDHQSYLHRKS